MTIFDDAFDPLAISGVEAVIPRFADRTEPRLGFLPAFADMNMGGFATFTRVETEPETFFIKHRGHVARLLLRINPQ